MYCFYMLLRLYKIQNLVVAEKNISNIVNSTRWKNFYLAGVQYMSYYLILISILQLKKTRHTCAILLNLSGGDTGEFSFPGQCKQPSAIPFKVHALLSIKLCKHCYQFHGNSLPPSSPWWLFSRCFLRHLLPLFDKCCNRIYGMNLILKLNSWTLFYFPLCEFHI